MKSEDIVYESGSSPRVRGKRGGAPRRARKAGLIPARAGKTVLPSDVPDYSRAHPRACGENRPADASNGRVQGSSPRVRGKLAGNIRAEASRRLIPARAGKTCSEQGA